MKERQWGIKGGGCKVDMMGIDIELKRALVCKMQTAMRQVSSKAGRGLCGVAGPGKRVNYGR